MTQEIKTKEQARQYAIDWQHEQQDKAMSYSELVEWQSVFMALAKEFDLTEEFIENGII